MLFFSFHSGPNAPLSLQCNSVMSTSLRITWSEPPGAFNEYSIGYTPGNGSPQPPIIVQTSETREVTLTNLLPNTVYDISIVTIAGTGTDSVMSNALMSPCPTSK